MIFISHRSLDESKAIEIEEYLNAAHGIESFRAPYSVNKDDKTDIAKWVIGKLNECSHVIALFSVNTVGSMWVPFELGAAYQAKKGIGTFIYGSPDIPSYLKTFPRMYDEEDLDKYAYLYLEDRRISKSMREAYVMNSVAGPDSFIRTLKKSLGQT